MQDDYALMTVSLCVINESKHQKYPKAHLCSRINQVYFGELLCVFSFDLLNFVLHNSNFLGYERR